MRIFQIAVSGQGYPHRRALASPFRRQVGIYVDFVEAKPDWGNPEQALDDGGEVSHGRNTIAVTAPCQPFVLRYHSTQSPSRA